MNVWNVVMMAALVAVGGEPTLDGGAQATGGPQAAAPKDAAAPAEAPAMTPEVKSLVDRMQAFYEGTKDFTVNFRQDYTYKTFKRTQTSSGKIAYKKPGLLRWDYEKPAPKTFVLAGDKIFAYDPEAMTLTRSSIDTSQLSASVTFLLGKGRLAEEFAIAKGACSSCKGVLLELTPLRPDPRFKQVKFEVDPKTAQVLRSIVVDPTGDQNAITFSDLKPNVGLTEEAFKLSPPPNTQFIDLTRGR